MLAQPRPCLSRLSFQLRRRAQARLQHCCYATAVADLPQPGDKLHGFTLKTSKHVPELELTALHLEHDKTGAQHLHIAREDKNNVFAIGFKTNPPDHTGVPHILEHLVLCGSEKYPVRDPFFKMMPRSLQNFMNAFTSQDHTTYPFATTNAQDFKNLMSIYLDATLRPLLKQQDFAQEGWRVGPANTPMSLEEASKDIPESDLVFKGVVYNEMKGSMSSGDMLYAIRWRDHVFPAINNSGGIPQQMTNLTHEQLKQFHADHYHPSNAKLFTYGNVPVAEHLKDISLQLEQFDKANVDSSHRLPISLQDGPRTVTVSGPFDEHYPRDQQYKASISWIMNDTSDVLETFSLALISSLLIDGYSSPLYQNTIEVGWGASYSSNTGFDSSGKISTFSVGLNGLKKPDVTRLNAGIQNTLKDVKRRGTLFSMDKVEGQLHQIELSLKHKSAHFGMGVMSRLTDSWFSGVDPMEAIAAEETLAAFRAQLQKPNYLLHLFEKYWLNDNTFTFIMEPSDNYNQEIAEDEASRLSTKISEISGQYSTPEEARKSMARQEFELQEIQENAKNEDVSCLPSLHVRDIPRAIEQKPVRAGAIGDTKIQWREAPTNGLTYFRGIYQFKDLPDELRVYLPLFSEAIQRLGTDSLPVERLEDKIRLYTGGISVGHHTSTSPFDRNVCEDGLSFSSYALDRNVDSMFELVRALVLETNFDAMKADEKIAELIKGSASNAIDEVAETGHIYARRFAEAGISPQARLVEETAGLTQVRLMADLAARSEGEGLADVIDKLKAIQMFALASDSRLRIAMTCGPESSSNNEAALARFLEQIPTSVDLPVSTDQVPYPRNAKSFFPLPYQVYYTAMTIPTVPYSDPAGAPLQVLSQLLTHRHIHNEIREKGGAYGGSAYAASLRGTFGYTSYRDPNPLRSLQTMTEAGVWARDKQWTDRDMEEAKLGVFQALDAPESVNEEGMLRFLTGVDEDMEQRRREQLLNVSPKDVNAAADRFLVKGLDSANIAALGRKQDWSSPEEGWVEMPMSTGEGESAGEPSDGYVVV